MKTLAALGLLSALAVAAHDARAQRAESPALEGKRVEARNGVVSSANALASDAGVEMLRAGGNSVDAAVATAFALGVVEPQMSGLGGGGAATVWMSRDRKPAYIDFYPAQPADAWRGSEALARASASRATSTEEAPGDASDLGVVGVPGAVAGLLALHERYGVLTRAQVLAPAIRLADEGFAVGQILAGFIATSRERMRLYPAAFALYFPAGEPLGPGDLLRNPALAASLRRVAADGRRGFYEGAMADAVVGVLRAGGNPVRTTDFAKFEPQWKRPLCTSYRGYAIVSAAPPQTGYQVLHTLELLEPIDLKSLGLPTRSARAFDVMVSALRAGQAETRFNSDPNWAPVAANGLASSAFAESRRALIGSGTAVDSIPPADPRPFDRAMPAGDCARYDPYPAAAPAADSGTIQRDDAPADSAGETTHLSVVDKDGNAVALTITNSSVWGSGGFAEGFFLNNSGFRFTNANIDASSRSGWRVRNTTIAPTIVLKNGEVQVVIGAPGGGRIPTEIVQVLVYLLDYGLDPLDAVQLPRIFPSARNPQVQLEHGFTPALLREVRTMGYRPVAEGAGYARLYLVARRGRSWVGVADPRHDGLPRGY